MESGYLPLSRQSDDSHGHPSDYEDMEVESKRHLQYARKKKLMIQILLLLTATALIGFLPMLIRTGEDRRWIFPLSAHSSDHINLYPDIIPSVPIEIISFEEHPIYASPPSAESDQAWDELLPPGRGFVFVDADRSTLQSYKIPPGEHTEFGVDIYSVAVFHQLHCLGMLRNNYWALIEKAASRDPDLPSFGASLKRHGGHANHCFDYLRQALQCAGDLALEWPGEDGKSVDGWGVPHQCKSWNSIMRYMDENHFNASKRTDVSGE